MISKHISDKEGVYSITATRRGLDNNPSQFELANMKKLAEQVFEPLREWVGGCKKTNAEMYAWIKENLNFDQMIWEFGDDDNPNWVHISYVNEIDNRNRCLKAYKDKGKTKYMVI